MHRIIFALLLLAPAVAGAAVPPPTLARDSSGVIRAALPRLLLHDRTVDKHLHSGLTTTFIVQVAKQSVARIEVRFELWDELYLLRAVGADGREHRASLRDRNQLEQWWSAASLVVARPGQINGPVSVDLVVLPFSAVEEADAKRWLARSASATERPSSSSEATTGSRPSLFSAVVDSSLRRKPVQRYSWLVKVQTTP